MDEEGKKRSLRNEKLKANSASETEEQRKERLRIGCKKDRARRTRGRHSNRLCTNTRDRGVSTQ